MGSRVHCVLMARSCLRGMLSGLHHNGRNAVATEGPDTQRIELLGVAG